MMKYRITVFDLFDNFFGSQDCPNAERLNNRKIRELREHLLKFYAAYEFTPRTEFETRLYLGSFLSSPPFPMELLPYLSSALLHSDSIVLFDPLHYWFCDEQYQRERFISAPTGWKNLNTRRPDYELTKRYLSGVFKWLYNLRPLVDARIIELIPAEQIVYNQIALVTKLAKDMTNLIEPIEALAENFPPDEITVDDNRKGLFTFAGGERNRQIKKAIGSGIELFSKDVVIADITGSIYTAPFRWEQHLGKSTLDGFAISEYHATVIEGMRNLRLPILANLAPDILVKIHKDSQYTEFRTQLREALKNIQAEIGSQDFTNKVAQIEKDILLPKIEAIQRETQSGGFKAATKAVQEGFFAFTQTFLSNIVTGSNVESNLAAGTIAGGLSFLREIFGRLIKSRDHRIWAQLLPEKPSLSVYGSPLILKQQEGVGWEIDKYPSMKVNVSRGVYKS